MERKIYGEKNNVAFVSKKIKIIIPKNSPLLDTLKVENSLILSRLLDFYKSKIKKSFASKKFFVPSRSSRYISVSTVVEPLFINL